MLTVAGQFPISAGTGNFPWFFGCLQASFRPFSPHTASAECKKGKTLPSQRLLLGLVTASVLLGQFVPAVRAALTVYPSAKVEQIIGGLLLHPSFPPVHRSSVAVSVGLADHVRRSLPTPTTVKHLKPETVEQFRNLYPRLDVYACKGDFDAWLEGKGHKPTHYDKAFLGFSKKWIKGKI
jgi:hypothetical protein